MLWNFTMHLNGFGEFTDELAEALYGDCSVCTLSSSNAHAKISMGREFGSLNDAIRSAVSDIRRHGLDIDRVEIEEEDLADWPEANREEIGESGK